MELRELGRSGFNVSVLGLGTVKLGRNEGVKYPAGFELPDDKQVIELLELARELGLNLLDTAPAYGMSEDRLGRLLPNPEAWIIATKVGETFRDGRSHFNFSAAAVTRSVEASLRRLRRDVLDIVLIHSDGRDQEIVQKSGALEALVALRQRGDIAAIGLSSKTIAGGLAALDDMDLVMVTLNPGDQSQLPVIEAAAKWHKGVLIKKALASGHLPADAGPAAAADALRQTLATPGVHSAIIGTLNPAHLRQNCEAVQA